MAKSLRIERWMVAAALLLLMAFLVNTNFHYSIYAQESEETQAQISVSVQIGNIRVSDEFKGKIDIKVEGEDGQPYTDSSELNIPTGGIITHQSDFALTSSEFVWSVEIFDDAENRMLFIKGKANVQGQAWYTDISFPGRGKFVLVPGSEKEGIITFKLSALQAILQFRAEWKKPEEKTFLLSFALDGDGDGKFDAGETSIVEASLLENYLEAESTPLISARKVADFKISATDTVGNKLVDVEGKIDFENNEWRAYAWFDKEKIGSISVKPVFKASELLTTLPNLVSIAEESEGLREPGWQEGAEMLFREPASTLTSSQEIAEEKGEPIKEVSGRADYTELTKQVMGFIENYWMVWIIFLLIALVLVVFSLLKTKAP